MSTSENMSTNGTALPAVLVSLDPKLQGTGLLVMSLSACDSPAQTYMRHKKKKSSHSASRKKKQSFQFHTGVNLV